MKAFHSGREAKEFLISNLVAQARQENVPLSEVERKMLYFTEGRWALPDMMRVSEEFNRECDRSSYERKVAKLVLKADKRIRRCSRDDYDTWWAAIRFLQPEDHYISVMIRLAGLRPRGGQMRLFAAGLGAATCILVWVFLSIKYNILMPGDDLQIFALAFTICFSVGYILLRLILGSNRTDDITSKVLEDLVRIYQRVSGTA